MNPRSPNSLFAAIGAVAVAMALTACASDEPSATATPIDTAAAVANTATEPAPNAEASPAQSASPAPVPPAASPGAKLPKADAMCSLISLEEMNAIFGVTFTKATPFAEIAEFPQCRWETGDDVIPGVVNLTLCCPAMTDEQLKTSLALRDAKELAPKINGVVYTDDTSRAQIHAFVANVYMDAVPTNIGPKNDIGIPRPTEAELDKLKTFVETFGSKL